MDFDLVTLYAYSDGSHCQLRQLWRRFFLYLLPTLLECDCQRIHSLNPSLSLLSLDDIFALPSPSLKQMILEISGLLAKELGLEPEIGVVAFLEINYHSVKTHALRSKPRDSFLLAQWLKRFQFMDHDTELSAYLNKWKKNIHGQL